MLSSKVFGVEFAKLLDWFGKEVVNDQFVADYMAIASNELTDIEFQKACKLAKRDLNPHPSFFPSPKFLIESVHGTIADRALLEWMDTTRLSAVGRKAFAEIGGSWAKDKTDRPELLKKDFVAAFTAIARQSEPQDLRREAPKVALPSVTDYPIDQEPISALSGDLKLFALQTKLKLGFIAGNEIMQLQAIVEAESLGYQFVNGEIKDAVLTS